MKSLQSIFLLAMLIVISSCGGGGGGGGGGGAGEGSATFTVSGTVSGLSGSAVVHLSYDDATDTRVYTQRTVTQNGAYSFTANIPNGKGYWISIEQPTGQVCSLSITNGTISSANITNANMACVDGLTIGGTISGLREDGASVSVRLGGGGISTQWFRSNGSFSFEDAVLDGTNYDITLYGSTTNAECVLSNGAGTVSGADVTDLTVVCTPKYTVGGTISGIYNTSSNGASALYLNWVDGSGSDDTYGIVNDGSYTFSTSLYDGDSYNVTQPSGTTHTCVVVNGSGIISGADIADIEVTCTPNDYLIGGTVTGLTGTIELQNNSAESLSVSANGSFNFVNRVTFLGSYDVAITSQPAGQYCSISNNTDSLVPWYGGWDGTDITDINVVCRNTYSVGGTVSGLTLPIQLQNNNGDTLFISTNGSFNFLSEIAEGFSYNVTVSSQTDGQVCSVSNGSGTMLAADVTGVAISCVPGHTIGGSVSGLTQPIQLQNNGVDTVSVSSNGVFTFPSPLLEGETYNVTVSMQTEGQVCSVSNGTGAMPGSNVANVSVNCVSGYTVGGTVSGLSGALVLRNNNADDLTLTASGEFVFSQPLSDGASYAVSILTKPELLECSIINGNGVVSSANISAISVNCVNPNLKMSVAYVHELPPRMYYIYESSTNSFIAYEQVEGIPQQLSLSVSLNELCGWDTTVNVSATKMKLADPVLHHYVLECRENIIDASDNYQLVVLDQDLNVLLRVARTVEYISYGPYLAGWTLYWSERFTTNWYPKSVSYDPNATTFGEVGSGSILNSVASDGESLWTYTTTGSLSISDPSLGSETFGLGNGGSISQSYSDWINYQLGDNETWSISGVDQILGGGSILVIFHGASTSYDPLRNRDVYDTYAAITVPEGKAQDFVDIRYFNIPSTPSVDPSVDCTAAWSGPNDVWSQQSRLQCNTACLYEAAGVYDGVSASCSILTTTGESNLCSSCQ